MDGQLDRSLTRRVGVAALDVILPFFVEVEARLRVVLELTALERLLADVAVARNTLAALERQSPMKSCLLYTSDAADE